MMKRIAVTVALALSLVMALAGCSATPKEPENPQLATAVTDAFAGFGAPDVAKYVDADNQGKVVVQLNKSSAELGDDAAVKKAGGMWADFVLRRVPDVKIVVITDSAGTEIANQARK